MISSKNFEKMIKQVKENSDVATTQK